MPALTPTSPIEERFTPSGVRLRAQVRRPGTLNWLFLPGGPGIGAESLIELAHTIDVPGTIWLVDLPGDGSNVDPPGRAADPYAGWPGVLLEAAGAVDHPVFLGHSTGGEYLLSVPELEDKLVGLVLVSTAPDARWMPTFAAMCERNPLPAVDAATALYEADPTNDNLLALAVNSAPWNFGAETVEVGAELLGRMPYNGAAVEWSAINFDEIYEHAWWPETLPTMILSGSDDRIVTQVLWDDDRFLGEHIQREWINGGAHFLWIERPAAVAAAFARFAARLG